MECKFCHAPVEDGAQVCPFCGADLTAPSEETAQAAPTVELYAEQTADLPAEQAAETEQHITTEDELIPGDPNGKPKERHGLVIAVVAVLFAAVAALCLYLFRGAEGPAAKMEQLFAAVSGKRADKKELAAANADDAGKTDEAAAETDADKPDAAEQTEENAAEEADAGHVKLSGAKSYSVKNEDMTDDVANRVVASVRKNGLLEQAKDRFGSTTPEADGLTNAQLALYYWENFYNYYNNNYYYAMYLGLDPGHMDTAIYDEEENRTWQEFFLSNAIEDYRTYTAACETAKAQNFEMPEDIAEQLEDLRRNLAERGEEDLNEQLMMVYGPGVTRKVYMDYIEKLFLGASYIQEMQKKIEPTDEDLSRYYDEHLDEYGDIPKDDTGTMSVRHILISPSGDDEEA